MLYATVCLFDDCKSFDLTEMSGGVSTLMGCISEGRIFEGNRIVRRFKCNKCGASFWVDTKKSLLSQEEIERLAQEDNEASLS